MALNIKLESNIIQEVALNPFVTKGLLTHYCEFIAKQTGCTPEQVFDEVKAISDRLHKEFKDSSKDSISVSDNTE